MSILSQGEECAARNLVITFVACTGTGVGGVPRTSQHVGKACYYSCVIAQVAVAAPSLS